MILLNKTECDYLSAHLATKLHQNMHRRHTRTIKGERTLEYAHIVKAVDSETVLGHIGGKNFDIEYEMKSLQEGGYFRIIRSSSSLENTIELLVKESKSLIKRVATDTGEPHPVNYKEGEFYVNRNKNGGRLTDAAEEALQQKLFPKAFIQNMIAWGFVLKKGHGKKVKAA